MSGYTRNYGMPQVGRDSTFPRFHTRSIDDPIATASAGRPIFRSEEVVQIIQPGNPNSPVLHVSQEFIDRWPEQYAAFKRGEEVVAIGTPLEQWPFLKREMVLELKAIGLHTVDQCAGLSDDACRKIGMGGLAIRESAKAYLDDAAAMSIVSEAMAARDKAEARIADMERQLEELRPMVDRLHQENMTLRNAPSAADTYVAGMHDPAQQAKQQRMPEPAAQSSLDSLTVARRPSRRPVEASA